MKLRVDLNADLGEGAGHDAKILPHITSASIACGLHAGEPIGILETIHAAHAAGVAVGAHPSLADREGFGRREIAVSTEEVGALVTYQLGAFCALAACAGAKVRHVKPHGALYHMAARDPALADAVAGAIADFDRTLVLFAPPRSELAAAGARCGLHVAREVFADRNYLADGSLVPRTRADALRHNADEAAERVLRMLREGVVRSVEGADVPVEAETICVHGDSPEAVAFARTLRRRLIEASVTLAPPASRLPRSGADDSLRGP